MKEGSVALAFQMRAIPKSALVTRVRALTLDEGAEPELAMDEALDANLPQSHGAGLGHATSAGRGYVCLQCAMPVNVFVARKSMGSPVHARSMPFAELCAIAVFVTNADVGLP